MVLWENHVNKLIEHNCYNITNVTVREYALTKFLSVSETSVIKDILEIYSTMRMRMTAME